MTSLLSCIICFRGLDLGKQITASLIAHLEPSPWLSHVVSLLNVPFHIHHLHLSLVPSRNFVIVREPRRFFQRHSLAGLVITRIQRPREVPQ
jgi:hypothetical protein